MASSSEPQQQQQQQQQPPSDSSALHDNIKSKGQNSYYYAHKRREDVEIHEWDGKAAPRLLKTQTLSATEAPEPTEAITAYAWADGKKRVSVYITLPDIHLHPEEHTVVDWSDGNNLALRIQHFQGKTRVLSLKLYESISGVTTKRKENQLVLQLTKATETRWYSLKKDS